MKNLVKDEVRKLKAYTIEGMRPSIMLDANENPYELPEEIVNRIAKEISCKTLNRYPDARAYKLCSKLAEYIGCGVTGDMVMAGDGSDELINIIISAFVNKGRPVILPSPGFAMYNIFSTINEARIIDFKRNDDFTLDIEKLIDTAKKEDAGLVFLCSPNNPTGTLTSREDIIKLLENLDSMVVVDEAYAEFSGETSADLIERFDNLIILRTLSKAWGLAGIRLGYLISKSLAINELLKVKSPFNVNSVTQEIAYIMLDSADYMKEKTASIIKERDFLIENLEAMSKVKTFDTSANFILIRVPDADALASSLREKDISVRNFNGYQGLDNCIRITAGRRQENEKLLEVIRMMVGD